MGLQLIAWLIFWAGISGTFTIAFTSPKEPKACVIVEDGEPNVGTVKYYNHVKGYGWIRPDAGGQDVFVHVTAVERADWDTLTNCQRVRFSFGPQNSAVDLRSVSK